MLSNMLKKIALFSFLFIIFGFLILFAIKPVSYKYYIEKEMPGVIEEKGPVDMIALGDSQIVTSLIPEVFEEGMNDVNCFYNGASNGQTIKESYYYLKDLLTRWNPKYVIIGVDMPLFRDDNLGGTVVWERLKNRKIKWEYFNNAIGVNNILNIIPIYEYRSFFSQIPQNLKMKLSKEYKAGIDIREVERYSQQGYVEKTTYIGYGNLGVNSIGEYDDSTARDTSLDYLREMIEMCKEKGCKPILLASPRFSSEVLNMNTYDEAMKEFYLEADRKDMPLIDMNLYKDRAACFSDEMFFDHDHMSNNISDDYSKALVDIINRAQSGEDVTSLFWSGRNEWKECSDKVIACDYHTELMDNGDRKIFGECVHGDIAVPEYSFMISYNNCKDWTVIRDYSLDTDAVIPKEYLHDEFILRIVCRNYDNHVNEVYRDKCWYEFVNN